MERNRKPTREELIDQAADELARILLAHWRVVRDERRRRSRRAASADPSPAKP